MAQNFYQPYQPVYGYQPMMQPQMQTMQQPVQRQQQPMEQPIYKTNQFILQGKSVDSVDVVKAMDIPLDGSISYFPLTDGTAIVSKQLQMDGTSKTVIYKPVDEKEIIKETPKYITDKDLEEAIKKNNSNFNNNDLKEELKLLKKQVKNLSDDFEELMEGKD